MPFLYLTKGSIPSFIQNLWLEFPGLDSEIIIESKILAKKFLTDVCFCYLKKNDFYFYVNLLVTIL